MRVKAVFIVALIAVSWCEPSVPAQAPPLAGLEPWVETAMAAWEVPGLAVAIVKDDAVVYARGFGVREIGRPAKVDERTLFAIASNTKAFTAALLGILKDEGKLGWETRVGDVLPWFRLHDPWVTRDLRVNDLLCHRSGLPTFGGDHLWIGATFDRREILERLRHLEPTAPFRGRFQYQNLMYAAAGELIPALTGRSWDEMLAARLFDPLGMSASLASSKNLAESLNVAWPHERRGGRLRRVAYDDVDAIAAAGGIVSNVVDVAKWLRLNLSGGRFGGKRLLSEAVVREMQTIHTPLPLSPAARADGVRLAGYGLGWGLSDYRGRMMAAHGGGLSGMISRTAILPDEGLGIVVLSNRAPSSLPRAVVRWIIDRYLGGPETDWSAVFLDRAKTRAAAAAERRRERDEARVGGTEPRATLTAYAGRYRDELSGDAEVSLREGRLYFRYNDRHRGYLEPWHHDTFLIRWRDAIFDMPDEALLTFGFDESGRVAKLWTTFYDSIRFDRVRDDGQ